LLLCIAYRLGDISDFEDRAWKEWMPGIATLLHWFAKPGEKLEIADRLLAAMRGEVKPSAICHALKEQRDRFVHPPPSRELEATLHLPDDTTLSQWRWWPEEINPRQDQPGHQRGTQWRTVFERTAWSREMLLYAQRVFLAEQFADYDPSRRDLWAGHNRPWDFDHLHASYYFAGKQGDYARLCREWGNCVGNLRAWPFEDNRSDSKETLKHKLANDPRKMAWSFIDPEDIGAFSSGDSARHKLEAAHALCLAIKKRYLAIYDDWYSSTRIAELLPQEMTNRYDRD
jgi:hypothetical protein